MRHVLRAARWVWTPTPLRDTIRWSSEGRIRPGRYLSDGRQCRSRGFAVNLHNQNPLAIKRRQARAGVGIAL
jgi:hypothetical protein